MDHHSRIGDRDDLVRDLRQFAADRAERGESERAEEASRAADELAAGGESTYFERVHYAIGDPDRTTTRTGSRKQLLAELNEARAGWEHLGKGELAVEAETAIGLLLAGAEDVRVGHLRYEVRI